MALRYTPAEPRTNPGSLGAPNLVAGPPDKHLSGVRRARRQTVSFTPLAAIGGPVDARAP